MTSSMSAALPIASVMAEDGVSGEMATPARMPFALICWMRATASAEKIVMRAGAVCGSGTYRLLRCGSSRARRQQPRYRPPTINNDSPLQHLLTAL